MSNFNMEPIFLTLKIIFRSDLQFESGFFDICELIRRISLGEMSFLALARCF